MLNRKEWVKLYFHLVKYKSLKCVVILAKNIFTIRFTFLNCCCTRNISINLL